MSKFSRTDVRNTVRAAYVQGADLTVAAAAHGVPYSTAVSWKTADKKAGNDWDIARRARQMSGAGAQEMFAQILEEVGTQFVHVIDLIKSSTDMNVAVKAELLIKSVDALSKAAKLAGLVSPEINELAVAMKVIRLQTEHIGEHAPDLRLRFIDLMSAFGLELPRLMGIDS